MLDLTTKLAQLAASTKANDVMEFAEEDGWMETKLDGYRGLVARTATGVEIISRSTKRKTGNAPHIEKLMMALPIGTVLDGEFCMPSSWDDDGNIIATDFTKTSNIMGGKAENAAKKQAIHGLITYVVFDILSLGEEDLRHMPNDTRRVIARGVVEDLDNEFVVLTTAFMVSKAKYDEIIEAGGEGAIFKYAKANYLSDDRKRDHWSKIKSTATADVVIMGYTEPRKFHTEPDPNCFTCKGEGSDHDFKAGCPTCGGRRTIFFDQGLIGAIIYGQYKDGILTKRGQCSGMTLTIRRQLSAHPFEFIGDVMEVKHYGLQVDGFRHPQFRTFRDDKLAVDCTWDEV